MSNVTLAIPDDTLRRARIRAVNEGTSVNAKIREYISEYAGDLAGQRQQATERFLEWARTSRAYSGPDGITWTRDDLYDR